MHKSLATLKIETKEVKVISFVGKQARTVLITSVHAPNLIENLYLGGCDKHLEKFDPLSSEDLKRDSGSRDKQLEELMMIGAARAAARSLFVVINNWWR